MRSAPRSILFTLAAACWLAAGPGGLTVREVLVCRHHAAHHTAGHHPASPADGPCFCDQMAGALDLAVSTAVPTPLAPPLSSLPPVAAPSPLSRVPSPQSPAFPPVPPPPNALGWLEPLATYNPERYVCAERRGSPCCAASR